MDLAATLRTQAGIACRPWPRHPVSAAQWSALAAEPSLSLVSLWGEALAVHALWRAGVSLSFHTDNRLMSRVDHSSEAASLVQAGFGWDELLHMGLDAAAASFLPAAQRDAAQARLRAWAAAEGLPAVQRP